MNKKTQLGQFFTKKADYIIGNLLNDLPKNKTIVEPFCGEGDLLILNSQYEIYDIDPKLKNCIKQDTLLFPPNYKDKIVLTNPPFLAKNKNKDKKVYEIYKTNDLYKAAILSVLECDGGILILPLNFLCDEDVELRQKFFNVFDIINLNIFEETVFDDTSYTICSFSFKRKENNNSSSKDISCTFFPSNQKLILNFNNETGWRIGGDFLKIINNQQNIGIGRLVVGKEPNSQLFLRAIDSGSENGKISLSLSKDYYYGKDTDRSFATIILNKEYSLEEQTIIMDKFNELLNDNRTKYNSLFLTNYRNSSKSYSRKRISFDFVYKLISYIILNYLKT